MSTDYSELGRRFVACKHFRWIEGMRWRFDVPNHQNVWSRYMGSDLCDDEGNPFTEANPFDRTHDKRIVIDLSDAATKGCVLQLIRDAHQDQTIHIGIGCSGWVILSKKNRIADVVHHAANFDSEEKAMVVAMEAAP